MCLDTKTGLETNIPGYDYLTVTCMMKAVGDIAQWLEYRTMTGEHFLACAMTRS